MKGELERKRRKCKAGGKEAKKRIKDEVKLWQITSNESHGN